jgi:uncharacterized protein (TIGR02265 family)
MYTTDGSMFEGLFLRALGVEPGSALAADLRSVGFDVARLQSHYDISVWVASVDVAWRHVYPQQDSDRARPGKAGSSLGESSGRCASRHR